MSDTISFQEKILRAAGKILRIPVSPAIGHLEGSRIRHKMLEIGKGVQEVNDMGMDAEYSADGITIKKKEQSGETQDVITIEKRAAIRITAEAVQKQQNLENTLQLAFEQADYAELVSDEEPSPDVIQRIAENAQATSNEDMQAVWAKLLAGEIRQPGSFSLRTIHVLNNMTQAEAQLFSKVANLVFSLNNYRGYSLPTTRDMKFANFGWSEADRIALEEIGVLSDVSSLQFDPTMPDTVSKKLVQGQNTYKVDLLRDTKTRITIVDLNTAGQELLRLVDRKDNYAYQSALVEWFKGMDVELTLNESDEVR